MSDHTWSSSFPPCYFTRHSLFLSLTLYLFFSLTFLQIHCLKFCSGLQIPPYKKPAEETLAAQNSRQISAVVPESLGPAHACERLERSGGTSWHRH